MREEELLIFRCDTYDSDILKDVVSIVEEDSKDPDEIRRIRLRLCDVCGRLMDFGARHGFLGNIWHHYLSTMLVNSENAYSRACEMRGRVEGTIRKAALADMVLFKEFYDYDFAALGERYALSQAGFIVDYEASGEESRIYNSRIRERICELTAAMETATDAEGMLDALALFYGEYGVGRFGLHKAFRVEKSADGHAIIVPIIRITHVKLDDLVGYETAKNRLRENTDAFLAGHRANNCLLYGDAGTGKSSSIKAITNEYFDRGLRVIEIYKHQFELLNDVISQIKDRNYRFIIYMDDLSFEDFEIEYKYLKAVIEGDLEKRPENVLIYATSNRRHLINEKFSEREDSVHVEDTMQEKFSLSARFGCSIYFGAPDKKEYQNIVKVLAKRSGLSIDEDRLMEEAGKWELYHGGMTGRCARQFIDYMCGKDPSLL